MIRFRPLAARELTEDVRYYEAQRPGRGGRFAAEVSALLDRIAEAPLSFPVLIEPDVRSAKVPCFPYRVVFLEVGPDIDVLAVAHAKRRPKYWRGR
ncbi:MAG TPA: type II toxin-antitoxin system RelE/ParE family toxin [Polyangiaceae bacterium]